MREPNPVLTALANGDIDALLAHHRESFGDTAMTADPAAAAPPAAPAAPPAAPPGSLVIPVSLDPRTGEPTPQQPASAIDPAGVWSTDVTAAPGVHTVPPPTAPAAPSGAPTGQPYVEIEGRRYFTEEFLEQARSQERDKMHTRLTGIEQELEQQRKEREAREEQIRQEAEAAARTAEAQRLSEMSTEERVAEMARRLDDTQRTFQEQWAMRDAMDEQEKRLRENDAYRQRRVAEERDLIHPTLLDLVGGTTPQEVEQSIADLKARTDAIVGTMRDATVAQRQAMPGVAPTGAPPVGPMDHTSGYQSLSPADIAAMDPATYAKNRPAIMEAMRRQITDRGSLYGG